MDSNLSEKEISDAYDKGSNILGFDFRECCIKRNFLDREYTIFSIREREYKLLYDNGLHKKIVDFPTWHSHFNLFSNGLNLNNNSLAYLQLYLFVAMLGNKSLEIENIKEIIGYEI